MPLTIDEIGRVVTEIAKGQEELKKELASFKADIASAVKLPIEKAKDVAVELEPTLKELASAINRLAVKGLLGSLKYEPSEGRLILTIAQGE